MKRIRGKKRESMTLFFPFMEHKSAAQHNNADYVLAQ
jgi:hypothetical protein